MVNIASSLGTSHLFYHLQCGKMEGEGWSIYQVNTGGCLTERMHFMHKFSICSVVRFLLQKDPGVQWHTNPQSSFGLIFIDIHVICRTGMELDYFQFHTIFGMEWTATRPSSFSTVLVVPTNLPYKNMYICIMIYKI